MEIENNLIDIQKSCDDFIAQNFAEILVELEQNKVNITMPFPDFKADKLQKKSWGVYVFYITPENTITTYEDLNNLWQNKEDQRLHSPKAIKGRFEILNSGKQCCLYVGKSENLVSRISQHIHQKTKHTTYGLKLSKHDTLSQHCGFSYSYYVIKENPPIKYKDSMKCLLVTLERHLRNKLEPLIGKQ